VDDAQEFLNLLNRFGVKEHIATDIANFRRDVVNHYYFAAKTYGVQYFPIFVVTRATIHCTFHDRLPR